MSTAESESLPDPHGGTGGNPIVFLFHGTSIEVNVDDANVALWLKEFFYPWFAIDASQPVDFHVRMRNSLEYFEDFANREAVNATHLQPCFGLDSKLVSCHGWVESDGTTLISDKDFGCYYRLRDHQIEVISRPQDRLARIGLMRVLRELATSQASTTFGMINLHAAAFVFEGRSIVLAGAKQAGKTTLLLHALTSSHTALMANDRVIADGSRMEVSGVPTIVAVRPDTEKTFPSLLRMQLRRAVLLHEGELTYAAIESAGSEQRLILSPAQLARQMNSRIVPQAPIGALLFPEISSSLTTVALEPLDRSEAASLLRQCIYGSQRVSTSRTVFQKLTKTLPGATESDPVIDRLTASLPAFRCRLGRSAYCEDPHNWLKLLSLKAEATII